MNVSSLVTASATRSPSSLAWAYGDRRATYAELAARAGGLAAELAERGLDLGDRIVLCLPNRPELLEVLLAGLWGGYVVVPVNWHLHPDEVRHIVEDSEARAILVAQETAHVRAALEDREGLVILDAEEVAEGRGSVMSAAEPAAVQPEDPAWLFYTSGTTGRPKGAILSHRNLLSMTLNYYADVDPVAPESVFVHGAPLTHGSGLYLLPALGRAAANVIFESMSFDVGRFLSLIEASGATHVAFLAPTMLRRLVDAVADGGHRLPALRSIVVGGAPLYASDLDRALENLGPIITQIYGQGEAPMTITVMPAAELAARAGDPERLATCGRPFTGVRVRVVDGAGRSLDHGADGEVCVAGDVVMNGYWRNDDANRAALREGWLHTGDIGHFAADGYLHLTDRAKDVIITGGSNVYPREVEEILLTFPGVEEVAVVGSPDPEWGEAVWAYVVLGDGVEEDAAVLIEHARAHLASFKKPRHVVFLDELPKNSTGKVLKRRLSPPADHVGSPKPGAPPA